MSALFLKMSEIINKILSFKKRTLILGVVILIFGSFVIFSPYGVVKSIKLVAQRYSSLEEIKNLKKENDSLRDEIKQLKTDTLEIEKVAREQYGMVKKGEKVYLRKKKN
jgi:cell division protein FtsB